MLPAGGAGAGARARCAGGGTRCCRRGPRASLTRIGTGGREASARLVRLGQGRQLSGALVRGNHTQTPGVPRLVAELGRDERVDDLLGDLVGGEAGADGDDVRVVVLA